MDSIEQLSLNFTNEAKEKELKEYCEKQYKEILRLLTLNKRMEEEIEHLKKLLTEGTSIIQAPMVMTNEELICIKQIECLKTLSDNEVLTKEEATKLDTYVKLLRLIRAKQGDQKEFLKTVNAEELLKVVEDVK